MWIRTIQKRQIPVFVFFLATDILKHVVQMTCVSAFQNSFAIGSRRHFRSTSKCFLNRFLFDPSEINSPLNSDRDGEKAFHSAPEVILPKDDYRTVHAAKILGLKNGDRIRAGLVSCDEHNGLKTDHAVVQWLPEGKVKKAEVLKNGNPPGSLRITLEKLQPPLNSPTTDSAGSAARATSGLNVSMLLALPRPLALGRMLPMISQMGVDNLLLSQARKVPKDYFGSHLLRKPDLMRERLIEGLSQAGDVRLPHLRVIRNLKHFLEDDFEELFPRDEYARVIAHPTRESDLTKPLRMKEVQFPSTDLPKKMVIAIGPEGGWDEPGELDLFRSLGFQQITLGPRTLRSDVAVVSLLSLAHEACQPRNTQ